MVAPLIAGAALSIGSSLFGSRSAKKAARRAEEQARQRQAQIQQYGRDALGRSQQYGAGLSEAGQFRPWNIQTGAGGWDIDPATGQATARLSPELQGYQDWAYGQSRGAQEQLSDFDRQGFAQQEFQRGQGLLQESRDTNLNSLIGTLRRKGISGFGTAMPGSSSPSNPLLNSLFERQNRQDLELADRSFGAADNQMDRLRRQATGMFGQGMELNSALNEQLGMNMRYGAADREMALQNMRNQIEFGRGQEDYYKTAALGGMEDVGKAQQMSNQARLGRDQGLASAFSNIGGSLFSGGMSGGGGYFGGGGAGFESGLSNMFGGPNAPSMYTASRTPSFWNPEF